MKKPRLKIGQRVRFVPVTPWGIERSLDSALTLALPRGQTGIVVPFVGNEGQGGHDEWVKILFDPSLGLGEAFLIYVKTGGHVSYEADWQPVACQFGEGGDVGEGDNETL